METQIFELSTQNERLNNELNKVKGSFKVDEDQIRQQIEEEFKERLNYKEHEYEAINTKLARITQEKIELTTRLVRLEGNNQELS